MSHFKLFEVNPSYKLNQDDLQLKYLQLQKQYHPDNAVGVDDQLQAVEKTIQINEAYDVLSNQARLAEYYLAEKGIVLTDKQVQENLDQKELMFLLDLQEQFMDNPKGLNDYKDQIRKKVATSIDLLITAIEENNEQEIKQHLAKVKFFSKSLKHMG